MKTIKDLTDLNGYTQAEVFPIYANLIMGNPSNEEVIRINKMIIDRWSNEALIRIKDRAWRIVYKQIANSIL